MLIGMVMNIVTKHRTGRTKEKGRLNIFSDDLFLRYKVLTLEGRK
ncbi:hypothetical protein HMPREF3156_02345 [Neisseria sp. HMSC06F02]|nr:hypothetical protein HMPREF3156_02345 [Neisseria sp. HMSC06F02]